MRAKEFIIERLITHGDNQFKIERLEPGDEEYADIDRKSTRLNSSHVKRSRMPSSA